MTGSGSGFGRKVSGRVALRAVLALSAVTMAGAADAAIFGVPTILSVDGQVCTGVGTPVAGCTGAAVDPPGFFILTGTASATTNGDTVHQLRLFVEVTGTTLDIRVFDPGDSGARDNNVTSQTQFQLLDPCSPFPTCTGAVRRTVTLVDDSVVAPITDNRLVRFSSTGAVFQAANAGATFSGLAAGLYEFRVSMTNAGTSTNAFGVEVRDGSGNPLNAFTTGETGAPATAFTGGARDATVVGAPVASITQPMTFFPYVNRGCSLETSNYDGDGFGSAALLDTLGTVTALTVSGQAVHSENAVVVESTSVVSQDSTNYGMWTLTNDTSQNNIVDWRVADYRGWADNPAALPRDPEGSFRYYLPNAYNPVTGSANATAPSEPILQSGFRVVSGANPPAVGSVTTYLITASLFNQGPGAISNVVLQIPLAAGATLVPGSPAATLDGVTTTCAEAGGVPGFLAGSATAMQCSISAAVPLNSVASLTLQVSYTPAAAGLLPVTGRPSLALSSLTRTATTATATTTLRHWLQTGDLVTIAGSTTANFNGARGPITVTGPNTFTYPDAAGAGAAPGTITATDTTSTENSVVALYAPASSSATFLRGDSAGPVCQMSAVVPPPVNLAVTKTDSPDPVSAGQNLTYTITVSNIGANAAPNATMTDVLPAGTTFQSIAIGGAGAAGWVCTSPAVGTNGTVSCIQPSLAIGAPGTTTFTVIVQVAAGTAIGATISNTATVASAGQDSDLSNNTATAVSTVNRRSDIAVTKTASPASPQPLQDITYTVTVTNNGPSNSSAVTVSEAIPANTTFRAIAIPSGWTCTGLPAVGGTGSFTCQVAAGLATGASARINLLVRVNAGVAVGTVISNTASAAVAAGQDTVAGNNSATATTTVGSASTAPTCATGDLGAGGTLAGVVNTYYPGTATAAIGATSITLGASSGAATPITAGDLVLVMQMQDATINALNDDRYGDGVGTGTTTGNGSGSLALNSVGLYEYVIALSSVPVGGGTLSIPAPGLSSIYTNAAATATAGQRRFQVVRVPQYANATLGSTLSAGRWNGTSGGILAFDVTGNLALGTAVVNLTGRGFRAGQGRAVAGPAGTDTDIDYRSPSSLNPHGSKGEGIAGTPQLVYSVVGGTENTGIDGYPNGSSARGAPGNAGGGGTDANAAANDENSGGGGGGNGGVGGLGGNSWQSNQPVGGFGGAVFPATATRLVLGGGGGAGSRNNSAGFQSSGGAGGAIVMIRTNTTSGTGTITTDGDDGIQPDNDGGGGGGAGGSVLFLARGQPTVPNLTVNARGGQGSDAWPAQAPNGTPGERHGPGGGGAGGWVIVSGAPTAIVVTGGVHGVTTTAGSAYNSTDGTGGQSLVTLTDAAIPASCPVSDLSITKTDNPDPASLGQPLTYTIVATNDLLTASAVSVTDTLPASVTFVSVFTTQGTCSFASPTLTCAIGVLASGQSATITLVVTPNATGTITNTATVTSSETEVTTANNSATATTTVNPLADLAVTKTDAPDPVQAGADLTYTIGITNNGPSAAAAPALAETVPTGTTFQSITPPAGWTCGTVPAVGGTGAIACTAAASMASGASVSFTLVVRVNVGTLPGALITNTATASTTTNEIVLANNSATAATIVSSAPLLLTRATIRGLRVDRAGRVAFATGTQRGTASFNIYATDDPSKDEDRVLLNGEPVRAAAADSQVPTLYEVRTAPITARYLLIEETDRQGRRHMMGPFDVGDARLAASYARIDKNLRTTGRREIRASGAEHAWQLAPHHEHRALGLARARAAIAARTAVRTHADGKAGLRERVREGLKVEISQPGRVSLPRAELEAAGLPPALPLSRLLVSTQGVQVAAEVTNPDTPSEALTFQAEGLSTTYTGKNVYVLTWSALPRMSVSLSREEAPAAAGWTRVSNHLAYATDAPQGTDPWTWDVVTNYYGAAWPPDDYYAPEAGTFALAGLNPGDVAAKARLRLVGASDHTHFVEAWINGRSLGSVRFEGRSVAFIDGLAVGLAASDNHLTLSYRTEDGSPDGFILIDHLDLAVTLAPSEAATVDDISPFDWTLPDLSGVTYLIVTHPAFAAQAESLAALKRAEGQKVAVVDVEHAYDLWSAGIVEAQAVRALVQQVFSGGRLRYVLLMGDDTYDPQDFSGYGEISYLPSLYGHDGDFGRVPSENRYADVDGDGSPDVAIGRLPVRTAAEADALVAKISRQAAVLGGSAGRHLMAADNHVAGELSFLAEADGVAARLRPGSVVSWARLDDGPAAARAALVAGIAASPSVIHYFGHGGPEVWADEDLLAVEDVAGLSGSGSVLLTWACQVQDYQYFGDGSPEHSRSVNEEMLLKPEGGALASFGPAGIADAAAQAAFYGRLYGLLVKKPVSLGEAIRWAKAAALAADPGESSVVESFNLLGDPSVVIEGMAPPERPTR